jgi:hypothetical protein
MVATTGSTVGVIVPSPTRRCWLLMPGGVVVSIDDCGRVESLSALP